MPSIKDKTAAASSNVHATKCFGLRLSGTHLAWPQPERGGQFALDPPAHIKGRAANLFRCQCDAAITIAANAPIRH
jgi:hypothetical protein